MSTYLSLRRDLLLDHVPRHVGLQQLGLSENEMLLCTCDRRCGQVATRAGNEPSRSFIVPEEGPYDLLRVESANQTIHSLLSLRLCAFNK